MKISTKNKLLKNLYKKQKELKIRMISLTEESRKSRLQFSIRQTEISQDYKYINNLIKFQNKKLLSSIPEIKIKGFLPKSHLSYDQKRKLNAY